MPRTMVTTLRLPLVAALASAALLASGCALATPDDPNDGSWSRVEKRAVLLVSLRPDRSRFSSRLDTQSPTVGFDVDYAKAVAEQLGLQVRIADSPTQDVVGDVLTGKADLGIGAFTEEEAAAMSMGASQPYVEVPVYTLVAPARGIVDSPDDLAGKVLGVVSQAPFEKAVATRAGGAGTKTYSDPAEAYEDLEKGKIAALIAGSDFIARSEALPPGIVPLDEPYATTRMVLLVKKGSPNLTRRIDSAVSAVKRTAGFDQMVDKWLDSAEGSDL